MRWLSAVIIYVTSIIFVEGQVAQAPPPINVTPGTVGVVPGGTQQFTATGQLSVTWSASVGMISSAGLFTAPSTMPAFNTITITATGSGNQSGTATVTPPASSTTEEALRLIRDWFDRNILGLGNCSVVLKNAGADAERLQSIVSSMNFHLGETNEKRARLLAASFMGILPSSPNARTGKRRSTPLPTGPQT